MAVEIKGINNLIKKLDKLSSIESKKAVLEIAEDMKKAIYNACPQDSTDSKKSIGVCEVREYRNSIYVDVGLQNDKVPFDKWKGAWFNNWGWNYKGFHSPHIGWFQNAVEGEGAGAVEKLKAAVRKELKAFKE